MNPIVLKILGFVLDLLPAVVSDIEAGIAAVHAAPNGFDKVAAALPALTQLTSAVQKKVDETNAQKA